MPWNLSNDRPIYLQIVEQLERHILAGKYTSGQKFPTVRELATEAAVNPNTMQKALQELERTGLLVTNRTTGRTITENTALIEQLRQELAHKRYAVFKEEMHELGFTDQDLLLFIQNDLSK